MQKGLKEILSVGCAVSSYSACMGSPVQLFGTLWTSPPGSSVHGTFQTRILEWVALSFSRDSSLALYPHTPGVCLYLLHSLAGSRWILYHCTTLWRVGRF